MSTIPTSPDGRWHYVVGGHLKEQPFGSVIPSTAPLLTTDDYEAAKDVLAQAAGCHRSRVIIQVVSLLSAPAGAL